MFLHPHCNFPSVASLSPPSAPTLTHQRPQSNPQHVSESAIASTPVSAASPAIKPESDHKQKEETKEKAKKEAEEKAKDINVVVSLAPEEKKAMEEKKEGEGATPVEPVTAEERQRIMSTERKRIANLDTQPSKKSEFSFVCLSLFSRVCLHAC